MQNIDSYELDPNFAVVYSFLKSFGKHVGEVYDNITIGGFKEFLEAEEVEADNIFVRFHFKLIRELGEKAVKKADWERAVIKFCKDFPDGDDQLVKEKGYCSIPVHVKLRILKNLCEDQFEYNDKFNRSINDGLDTKDVDTFRDTPLGRDKLGRNYWFLMDDTGCLRLFRGWRNDLTGAETWNLVCRDFDELEELIDYLASEDLVLDDPPWPPVKHEAGDKTQTKLKVAAKTETKSEVRTKPETKSEVGAKTETKSEIGAKTETKSEVGAKTETQSDVGIKTETKSEARAKTETKPEVGAKAETKSEARGKSEARVTSSEETEIKPKCETQAQAESEENTQITVKDRTKIESWTKYAVKAEPISTDDIDFKAIADNVADMMASSKHYYRVPAQRSRRDVRRDEKQHSLRACTVPIKKIHNSAHTPSGQAETDRANEKRRESGETAEELGERDDDEPREKVKLVKKGVYKSVVYDPADEVDDETQESAQESVGESGDEGNAGEAVPADCSSAGESEPEADGEGVEDAADPSDNDGDDNDGCGSDNDGCGSDNDGCGSDNDGCGSDNVDSCAENSNLANNVFSESSIEKSPSKRHASRSSEKEITDKQTCDRSRSVSTDRSRQGSVDKAQLKSCVVELEKIQAGGGKDKTSSTKTASSTDTGSGNLKQCSVKLQMLNHSSVETGTDVMEHGEKEASELDVDSKNTATVVIKKKSANPGVKNDVENDKLKPCVVEVEKLSASCVTQGSNHSLAQPHHSSAQPHRNGDVVEPSCGVVVEPSKAKARLTETSPLKAVRDSKLKSCVVALEDISPCKTTASSASSSRHSSPAPKLSSKTAALKPCIVGIERLKSDHPITELQNKSHNRDEGNHKSQKAAPGVVKSKTVSSPSKHSRPVISEKGDADSKCSDSVKDKLKKKLNEQTSDACNSACSAETGDADQNVKGKLKKKLPTPASPGAKLSGIGSTGMKICTVKLDKLVSKDVMKKNRSKVSCKEVNRSENNDAENGMFELDSDASSEDDNFHETIDEIANTIDVKDNQQQDKNGDLVNMLPVSESGAKKCKKSVPSKKAANGVQEKLVRPWESHRGSDCSQSSASKPSTENRVIRDPNSVNHKPHVDNEVIVCEEEEEGGSVKSDKSCGSSRDSGNGSTDTDKQNIDNALKDLMSLEEIIKHGQGTDGQDKAEDKSSGAVVEPAEVAEPARVDEKGSGDNQGDKLKSSSNNDSGVIPDRKDDPKSAVDGCGDSGGGGDGSPGSSNKQSEDLSADEKGHSNEVVDSGDCSKPDEGDGVAAEGDKQAMSVRCSIDDDDDDDVHDNDDDEGGGDGGGESDNSDNGTAAVNDVDNRSDEENAEQECDAKSNSSRKADEDDVVIIESDSDSEQAGDLSAKLDCFTRKARDELKLDGDIATDLIKSHKQKSTPEESKSKTNGPQSNTKKSPKKRGRRKQPKRLTSTKKKKKTMKKSPSDEPISMMIDGELIKIEKVADSDSDVDIMNESDSDTKSASESDAESCNISKENTNVNDAKEEKDLLLKMYTSKGLNASVTATPPTARGDSHILNKGPGGVAPSSAGGDSPWSSMVDQALESLGLPSASNPAPPGMPTTRPTRPMVIRTPVPQRRPIQPRPVAIQNPLLAQNLIHRAGGSSARMSRPVMPPGVSLLPPVSYPSHMYLPPIMPKPFASPHNSWNVPMAPLSSQPMGYSSAGSYIQSGMPMLASHLGPAQLQTSTNYNQFSSGYPPGFTQPRLGLNQSNSTLRSIMSKPPLAATSASIKVQNPYMQFTVVKGGNGQFIDKTSGQPFTFPTNSRVVTLGPDDQYRDHNTGEIVPVKLKIGKGAKKPQILCLQKAVPKLNNKPVAKPSDPHTSLKDKLKQAVLVRQKIKESMIKSEQLKHTPETARSLEYKERAKRKRLRKQLEKLTGPDESLNEISKSDMVIKHNLDKLSQRKKRHKKEKKGGRPQKSDEEESSDFSVEEELLVVDEPEASSSADSDYEYEKISRRVRLAQIGMIAKIEAHRQAGSDVGMNYNTEQTEIAKIEAYHQAGSDVEMDYNTEQTVTMVYGTNARLVAQQRSVFCLEELSIDQDLKSACKVCGKEDNLDAVLVCDDCEDCYHMMCLCPPIIVFPLEDWFCPHCEHVRLVETLKTKQLLAKRFRQKFRRGLPRNNLATDTKESSTTDTITVDMFRVSQSNILQTRGRSQKVNYSDDKFDQLVTKAVKDAEMSSSDSDTESETTMKGSKPPTRSSAGKQRADNKPQKRRSTRKTRLSSKTKKKRQKLTDVNDDMQSSNSESDYNCSGSESSDDMAGSREDRDRAKKEMERGTGTAEEVYFTCSGRKTSSIARVSKYL